VRVRSSEGGDRDKDRGEKRGGRENEGERTMVEGRKEG
jgi:hypothetical protein